MYYIRQHSHIYNMTNSRFAILKEDIGANNVFNKKEKNKRNNNNNDEIRHVETGFNPFNSNNDNNSYSKRINRDFETAKSKENREILEKKKKEEHDKRKEAEKQKSLNIDSFPALLKDVSNKSENTTQIWTNDLIDKIKTPKQVVEIIKTETHIKPGWVEIKRDPYKKNAVMTYNCENVNNDVDDKNEINVLHALSSLYEKRTKEYISLWGYDAWEQTFRFPNYEYDYFDKLDEKYELEMQEFENENDNDFNNY